MRFQSLIVWMHPDADWAFFCVDADSGLSGLPGDLALPSSTRYFYRQQSQCKGKWQRELNGYGESKISSHTSSDHTFIFFHPTWRVREYSTVSTLRIPGGQLKCILSFFMYWH